MKKAGISLVLVLAAMLGTISVLGTSSADAQSGSRGEARRMPFETRLWNWLAGVHYENWAPVPGRSGEAYEGQSPHGAYLKMYLNRIAAGDSKKLPPGSILVKENYGKDKKTLMAVTVMSRYEGYNDEAYNWYFVKYKPDGTVATKGKMKLAGKVKGCIKCHSGAEGDDYAFFND